ncbi:MAG: S41 family peptidase [Acidobacteria bacterium]|nr:S41 family peptidase [Acidobacteriota bacterium]
MREEEGRASSGGRSSVDAIDDLMRRGEEERRGGRIDEALATFSEAQSLAPAHYGIRMLIADTLRRAGRAGEAMTGFEAAVSLDPARHEAYVGLARIQRDAFRFDEAERVIERGQAVVRPPRSHDLLVALAETRRQAGRTAEAEEMFRRALRANPTAHRPHAGLAVIAESRGDLMRALAHWDRYLDHRPDDETAVLKREELSIVQAAIGALREAGDETPGAEIRTELGRLLSIIGDQKAAQEAYREALAIEPHRPAAQRGLGVSLRLAGEDDGAARVFRRLLRSRPHDAVALYALAEIARASGSLEKEEAAWTRLLKSRPDDLFATRASIAFLRRAGGEQMERAVQRANTSLDAERGKVAPSDLRRHALILAEAGFWAGATEALYRALRADPTDPWTIEVASDLMFVRPPLLGRLFDRARGELPGGGETLEGADASLLVLLSRLTTWLGRYEEAYRLARRATMVEPDSAIARSALAEAAPRIDRDLEGALVEWHRTVDLDPTRSAARIDLALALLNIGRAAASEEVAREGLHLFPDSAPLASILGVSLMNRGRLEEAAEAFATALLLDPADNFGLARGQHPITLAALGRNLEARHVLRGMLAPTPELIYHEAWRFARDKNRDRHFNGQNWLDWRDRYRGDLIDLQDAHRAIAEMLGSLGDPHTRLRRLEETAAIYLARRGEVVRIDSMGRVKPGSRTVTMEELQGGLGYIRLSNFADPAAVEQIRQALLRFSEKEGLILDLRGNRGGFSRVADAIGDLLIGPGLVAGVDVGPDGAERQITRGDGALVDGPIVVLVDGQTASAAERLARALEMTGRGMLVGESTYGKGRAQTSRVLPGGATVLISMAEMLGPDGRPIQGRGLRPRRHNRPPGSTVPDAPDDRR